MGTWPNEEAARGPGFASAAQVARLAGVSRSAVSRTFTPGASVSPATRRKVEAAAQSLGYEVNALAQALLQRRSQLVGLVVTQPEAGFRAHLVAALTEGLLRRGNLPIVLNTGRDPQSLLAAQQALLSYRAQATMVLSGSPPASVVEAARRSGQALILIGRAEQGADQVRVDGAQAAREAVRRLVACGHGQHLGLLGSASNTPSVREREQAFVEQARAWGIAVTVAHGADADYASGRRAGGRLLAAGAGSLARPSAVFCVNDLLAMGLIDCARHDLGLRVPHDLSVIGFDDIPESSWGGYDLSTFRQDPARVAWQALQLLEARLGTDPPAQPLTRLLEAPFVARGSLAPWVAR